MNRRAILAATLTAAILAVLAVGASAFSAAPGGQHLAFLPLTGRAGLGLIPFGSGFDQVTTVTHAGDDRLFISQRTGEILVRQPDGAVSTFLDLSDRVNPNGAEYGFFDVAFHPGYADPDSPGYGFFYVTYTGNQNDRLYLILSRYRVSADPNRADPSSEAWLLRIREDSPLHKAGGLDFNRLDNHLFLGVGDDKDMKLAQDARSLKGKVLRVAVDEAPPDVVGNAEGRASIEIWAMGFRNPWRLDVDEASGRITVGDVGAGAWEEVNSLPLSKAGLNYGWPCREGAQNSGWGYGLPACEEGRAFEDPVFAFAHGETRCAIIGGHVHRQPGAPARYVFADVCSNDVFAMPIEGAGAGKAEVIGSISAAGPIVSLGEDSAGQPYAGIGSDDSPLFRLVLP